MTAPFAEALRFGLAGAVNTAFGFSVYSGLVVLLGMAPSVALLVATVTGVLFNFFTFGGFTFRRLAVRRLPRFVAAYALIYAFNLALLEGLRATSSLGPVVAQLLCLAVVAPAAYFVLKALVFQPTPDE